MYINNKKTLSLNFSYFPWLFWFQGVLKLEKVVNIIEIFDLFRYYLNQSFHQYFWSYLSIIGNLLCTLNFPHKCFLYFLALTEVWLSPEKLPSLNPACVLEGIALSGHSFPTLLLKFWSSEVHDVPSCPLSLLFYLISAKFPLFTRDVET